LTNNRKTGEIFHPIDRARPLHAAEVDRAMRITMSAAKRIAATPERTPGAAAVAGIHQNRNQSSGIQRWEISDAE
jgi:hypothetical protein